MPHVDSPLYICLRNEIISVHAEHISSSIYKLSFSHEFLVLYAISDFQIHVRFNFKILKIALPHVDSSLYVCFIMR